MNNWRLVCVYVEVSNPPTKNKISRELLVKCDVEKLAAFRYGHFQRTSQCCVMLREWFLIEAWVRRRKLCEKTSVRSCFGEKTSLVSVNMNTSRSMNYPRWSQQTTDRWDQDKQNTDWHVSPVYMTIHARVSEVHLPHFMVLSYGVELFSGVASYEKIVRATIPNHTFTQYPKRFRKPTAQIMLRWSGTIYSARQTLAWGGGGTSCVTAWPQI